MIVEGTQSTRDLDRSGTPVTASTTPQSRHRLTAPASVAQGLAALLLLFASWTSAAAEIKVLSAGAVKGAVEELAPEFERVAHHGVAIVYGTAGTLRAMLANGVSADMVILPAEGIAEAEERGWVRPATRRDLARVGIGVAVRKGAPLPDIATPEALKQALLAATAVAYVDPTRGTSGRHIDSVVLPALGIASEVRARARLQTEGSPAEFVRRGDADIAIGQVSELLAVEGVTVVGPLPASLQKISTYGAAITTNATATEPAREFIEFLSAPASKAVFRAKGMDAAPAP